MRLIYLKPELEDLSQGQRIAFAREFRQITQNELSDKLGITGENKRRTMTRYEKGDRNPKQDRTRIIAELLKINYNAIKKYDYKNPIDIIYTLIWLEELLPNIKVDLLEMKQFKEKDLILIQNGIHEWNLMKSKRQKREISYKEYIEWKLTYDFEVMLND